MYFIIGPNGGGVCDYFGQNPRDVDILMGTFSKGISAWGGYIAGSKELISYLRVHSQGFAYSTAMSPPVAKFIISALKSMMNGGEALQRVRKLEENCQYFRQKLQDMGFVTYGNEPSPVIPILVCLLTKGTAFIRECHKYNIAAVGVGFPATPVAGGRIRICLSASHTR